MACCAAPRLRRQQRHRRRRLLFGLHGRAVYKCTAASPSVCTTSIRLRQQHGGSRERSAIRPVKTAARRAARASTPTTTSTAVCGNNVIEDNETCDPPAVGNGLRGQLQGRSKLDLPASRCVLQEPACGDNIVQAGEGCDPPNVGNGCSAACQPESGYTCVGLGPSTCVKPACGNGVIEPEKNATTATLSRPTAARLARSRPVGLAPRRGVPLLAQVRWTA